MCKEKKCKGWWTPDSEYVFFFNDTATTEIYTLSLHDALPIWSDRLTLYAQNHEGYQRLMALSSAAYLEAADGVQIGRAHV